MGNTKRGERRADPSLTLEFYVISAMWSCERLSIASLRMTDMFQGRVNSLTIQKFPWLPKFEYFFERYFFLRRSKLLLTMRCTILK